MSFTYLLSKRVLHLRATFLTEGGFYFISQCKIWTKSRKNDKISKLNKYHEIQFTF